MIPKIPFVNNLCQEPYAVRQRDHDIRKERPRLPHTTYTYINAMITAQWYLGYKTGVELQKRDLKRPER